MKPVYETMIYCPPTVGNKRQTNHTRERRTLYQGRSLERAQDAAGRAYIIVTLYRLDATLVITKKEYNQLLEGQVVYRRDYHAGCELSVKHDTRLALDVPNAD